MVNDFRGILGYAQNAINSTPEIRDNPENAELIAAIRSGNAQEGERLANQILQKYGVSKGQGIAKAFQFFGFSG